MLTNEQQKEVLREITNITIKHFKDALDLPHKGVDARSNAISSTIFDIELWARQNDIDFSDVKNLINIESFSANVIEFICGDHLDESANDIDTIASTAFTQTLQQDSAMDK